MSSEVRFGSFAESNARLREAGFAAINGHRQIGVGGPFGANSVHTGVYLDVRQAAFATFSAAANPPAIAALYYQTAIAQTRECRDLAFEVA